MKAWKPQSRSHLAESGTSGSNSKEVKAIKYLVPVAYFNLLNKAEVGDQEYKGKCAVIYFQLLRRIGQQS